MMTILYSEMILSGSAEAGVVGVLVRMKLLGFFRISSRFDVLQQRRQQQQRRPESESAFS